MAKRPDLSANQQRIVNRYYANKDAIVETRLGDVVSELYIATAEGKQAPLKRLWNSARAALAQKGVPQEQIDRIVGGQDLKALALLAGQVSR
jgi:mevalonate kinase